MKKYLFLNFNQPNISIIGDKGEVTNLEWWKRISLKKLASIFEGYSDLDELLDCAQKWEKSQERFTDWKFQVQNCKYQPVKDFEIDSEKWHIFIPIKWDYSEFIKIRDIHDCNSEFFEIDGCYFGKLIQSGFLIKPKFEPIQ